MTSVEQIIGRLGSKAFLPNPPALRRDPRQALDVHNLLSSTLPAESSHGPQTSAAHLHSCSTSSLLHRFLEPSSPRDPTSWHTRWRPSPSSPPTSSSKSWRPRPLPSCLQLVPQEPMNPVTVCILTQVLVCHVCTEQVCAACCQKQPVVSPSDVHTSPEPILLAPWNKSAVSVPTPPATSPKRSHTRSIFLGLLCKGINNLWSPAVTTSACCQALFCRLFHPFKPRTPRRQET